MARLASFTAPAGEASETWRDPFVLLHEVDLVFVLLPGDRILLRQFLETREVDPRLIEQALIARKLTLELRLQQLRRARIDLCEEIALLDQLAFGEGHLLQLTVDLGLYRNGRDRRCRTARHWRVRGPAHS